MSRSPVSDGGLRERILQETGVNTARCYQCGKCSAGCPMAAETRWRPHDVMRMVNTGAVGPLQDDPSIWLCLACETCASRCPNGCDPARVIDALRERFAREAPGGVPRPVAAFHRAFLDQVRRHGRSFELGMVMEYKLRTGALTEDALSAPGLLARGKLSLTPSRISGIGEVRRIFDACTGSAGTGAGGTGAGGDDR
jgi:heterodisulfide reductase subunit C